MDQKNENRTDAERLGELSEPDLSWEDLETGRPGKLALLTPFPTVANCAFLVLARKLYSELIQEGIREFFNLPIETIAKPRFTQKCHSEQSEESRIFMDLRSFTSFRMTVK